MSEIKFNPREKIKNKDCCKIPQYKAFLSEKLEQRYTQYSRILD
jgi:hypothetical protein